MECLFSKIKKHIGFCFVKDILSMTEEISYFNLVMNELE